MTVRKGKRGGGGCLSLFLPSPLPPTPPHTTPPGPVPLKEGDNLRFGDIELSVAVTPILNPRTATVHDALWSVFASAQDAATAAAEARAAELYQTYLSKRRRALKEMGREDCVDWSKETVDGVGRA